MVHSNSRFIIATIACAIVFLLFVVAGTRKASHGEYVITLTEKGFVPPEIRILLGDTVRFSSTLDSQYWPASNLHPAHDIYPEFDPKRPLLPGESWSFTFDRPGAWRFHDHLRSYYTGVIYVEE